MAALQHSHPVLSRLPILPAALPGLVWWDVPRELLNPPQPRSKNWSGEILEWELACRKSPWAMMWFKIISLVPSTDWQILRSDRRGYGSDIPRRISNFNSHGPHLSSS